MQEYVSFSDASLILGQAKHAPFLVELKEEYDNELHITICCSEVGQGNAAYDSSGNADFDAILARCKPILPVPEQNYKILFENYIIYQVRNESFCSFDTEEIRIGKYLIVFEASKLLDYLSVSTDAYQFDDGTFYPGRWKHYGVYTQNHVIDIVSQVEPIVLRNVL